jgi:hypothetical protein
MVMPRAPRIRPGRITPARFKMPVRRRSTVKVGGVSVGLPGVALPGLSDDLLRRARGGAERTPVAPVTMTGDAPAAEPVLADEAETAPTGAVTLEELPEESETPVPDLVPIPHVPWPIRRRGPATLMERRTRLEAAARDIAGIHGAVEFQTNTVAIVNHGSIVARALKRVLWLMTLPPRIAAQAISWLVMPRGKGKLKRTVVVVDRRGNVVVYRV